MNAENSFIPICSDPCYASAGFLFPCSVKKSFEFKDVIFPEDIIKYGALDSVKCLVEDDLDIGDVVVGTNCLCISPSIWIAHSDELGNKFRVLKVTFCRRISGINKLEGDGYKILFPLNKDTELIDSERSKYSTLFGEKLVKKFVIKQELVLKEPIQYCSIVTWLFSDDLYTELVRSGMKGFPKTFT